MTDPWADLERRAAESTLGGITADTDDLLDSAELGEADINPNSKGGKNKQGGQQGGMPPMMMGGAGGARPGAAPGGMAGVDPNAMGGAAAAANMRAATPGVTPLAGASGLPSSQGLGSTSGPVAAGSDLLGDMNGDGIADVMLPGGLDLDGDGIVDLPAGPDGGIDLDGDGIPDIKVPGFGVPGDRDGDGIPDLGVPGDRDGDGIPDYGHTGDRNGDGILDRPVHGGIDLDGDGIADIDENGNPINGNNPIDNNTNNGRIPPGAVPVHGGWDLDGDGVADIDRDGNPISGRNPAIPPDAVRVPGGWDLDGDGVADVDDNGTPIRRAPVDPRITPPYTPTLTPPLTQGPIGQPVGPTPTTLPPTSAQPVPTYNTAPIGSTPSTGYQVPSQPTGPVSSEYQPSQPTTVPPGPSQPSQPNNYDGYTVDPGTLRDAGARWQDLSARMDSVTSSAQAMQSEFGLVPSVQPPYSSLSSAATQWSSGASSEFDNLTSKLYNVAGGYENAETSARSQADQVGK